MLRLTAVLIAAILLTAAAPAGPHQITLEERVAGLERRAEDADARATRDLNAQESMAKSARDMINVTLFQVWLAIAGTIGLGATVYYTRQTYKAASDELKATRDSAAASLAFDKFDTFKDDQFLRFWFRNPGATTLRKATWSIEVAFVAGRPSRTPYEATTKPFFPMMDIAGNSMHFVSLGPFPKGTFDDVKLEKACISTVIEARFEDIFGRPHTFIYRELRTGKELQDYWNDTTP